MNAALSAAPSTNVTLKSMSLTENTRPRKSSSISCCRIVVVQIATPWATTPSPNPIAMNSTWPKVSPSAAVSTAPPAASRT